MGHFKKDLYAELQQDAPFTDARKARILQGRPRKKHSYKPVFAVVSVIAMLLLFVLIKPTTNHSAYTVASMPIAQEDLLALLKKNEVHLPIAKAQDGQQVISPTNQSEMNSFDLQHFSHFPMVVEEKSAYEIGDYVMLDDYVTLEEDGTYSAVQIVGVGGDQVEVKNQQVYINKQALALPYMLVVDMDMTEPIDELTKELSQYVAYVSMYPLDPLGPTSFIVERDEIAVKVNQQIEVKKLANVVGKIVAIQEVKSTLVLTKEEQAYYEALKEQGLAGVQGAEPMTIAKLYIQAILEQEIDVSYLLTSNNENYYQITLEEYRQGFSNNYLTKEQFEQMITYMHNGIEQGIVSEYVTGEIQISYESEHGYHIVMKLRPNPEGIWQIGEITSQ